MPRKNSQTSWSFFGRASIIGLVIAVFLLGVRIISALDTTDTLTASGNEITDTVRTASTPPTEGDGRSAESSYGLYAAATNLYSNNGFETNTTGWVAQGSAVITRVTSDSKFGNASVEVNTGGSSAFEGIWNFGNSVTVSPSTTYTVSAWVKVPVGKSIMLTARQHDSGDNFLIQTSTTDYNGTGEWERLALTFTTQASGEKFVLALWTPSTQDVTFYADAIQLEANPEATAYTPSSRGASRIQMPVTHMNPTQGWVAFRTRLNWPNSASSQYKYVAWQWQDDANNKLELYQDRGQWILQRIKNGNIQMANAAHVAVDGDLATVVAKWTSAGPSVSYNGNDLNSLTVYDDFSNRSGALGTAQSGQTWELVPASGSVVSATISDGAVIAADSGNATTAAYAGIDLGAGNTPKMMYSKFHYRNTGTANSGSVGLISNPNGLDEVSDITNDSVHIVFTESIVGVSYYDGGAATLLAEYGYTTLVEDTEYTVGWSVSGNTFTIMLPDGTTRNITNATLAAQLGRYLTWEVFWDEGASSSFTAFDQIGATTQTATAVSGVSGTPSLTAGGMDIGSSAGSSSWLTGDVFWMAAGIGTLTNSDIDTIYSWGNTDPEFALFAADTQPTLIWDADSTTYLIRTYPGGAVATTGGGGFSAPVAKSCPDAPVSGTPRLYQIDTKKDSATLYFAPITGTHNHYVVAYGYESGDIRFSGTFGSGSSDGAMKVEVDHLSPNTTYYFKVRGGNGCQAGEWSNTLRAKTSTSTNKSLIFTAWEQMRELVESWLRT